MYDCTLYENFKKRWIERSIYFAAKKQCKRGTSADIINIIRSKRLQNGYIVNTA